MKVIPRTDKGYTQDPTHYLNFRRFNKQAGNFVLLEAGFGFSKKMRWGQYGFSRKQLNTLLIKKLSDWILKSRINFLLGIILMNTMEIFIKYLLFAPILRIG